MVGAGSCIENGKTAHKARTTTSANSHLESSLDVGTYHQSGSQALPAFSLSFEYLAGQRCSYPKETES